MKKLFTLLALTLLCVGANALTRSYWLNDATNSTDKKSYTFSDGCVFAFPGARVGSADAVAGDLGTKKYQKFNANDAGDITISGLGLEGTVTKIIVYNYLGGTGSSSLSVKIGTTALGSSTTMCKKAGTGTGGLTNATVFEGTVAITTTNNITISFADTDGKIPYFGGIDIEYSLPTGSLLPPTITESTEKVGSITVTMATESDATIKYTINGGSEKTYSSPITIDSYAEVSAWTDNGKKQSSTVSATYVVMPNLSSGKKWDFANISETDWTNLSSDTDGWTFDSDNNRYYNNKTINGIIIANHQALAATEGLKFNAGSEKIRINKGTGQLQLNGKDLPIFIPNLKTGQYITVIAKSGSSTATNRYISATNVEAICGFAESGTANVVTSIGKVTADGEVDLKTINGGMNILSIEITNDIPSYEVTVSIAGFATYTPSVALDFSSTTIKAYKASVSGNNISFTRVNQVAAGEGVLLYAEGGATENIPVGNKSAADSDNAFIGTLTDIASLATLSDDGAYTNYILNDGTSGIGFYKANGQKVAAGKAYLQVASSSSPAKSFFGFDAFNGNNGVVTGINEVKAAGNDNVLYNLNGVRMTSPTQEGIYILNGKKYIVK